MVKTTSTKKNTTTTTTATKTTAAKKAIKATAPKKIAAKKSAAAPKAVKRAPTDASLVRPARSRTAYMMFVKDCRPRVQTEHPEMSFVDITREVAKQWQALSGREKKPYVDRAAADKKRYDGEVAKFKEEHPGQSLTIRKKKRQPKLKAPTRARSAYVFYTKEQRPVLKEQHPNLEFGDLTKRVAAGWKALSKAQRAKFETQAVADRTRYEAEIAQFNNEHPEVARRRKRAKKNAPTKARSAYLYFTKDVRAELSKKNPDKSFGDLTKLVAARWKTLSDAQKKKYVKQAADDRKRYDAEMAAYTPMSDEELDELDQSSRKRARPDGPARAKNAYVFFTMDRRARAQAENPEAKFGEITKIIADEWKTLTDAAKGKYNEQAAADKIRYENEIAAAN